MRGISKPVALGVAVIVLIAAVAGAWLLTQQAPPEETTTPTPTETTPTTTPTKTTPTATSPSPTETSPTPVETKPKKEKVLRIAIGIDADTLDPVGQTTTLIANIVDHIVEPLFIQDENGNLVPWLAESYEIQEDGKVIIVKIRKGIKFQDGTDLTADAVKFTFDRILDPNVRVPLRSWFAALDRVEVVDDYTVKFVLKYPYAPFLRVLTTTVAGIVSPNAVKELGDQISTNPKDIGTGPFKFAEWVKGDQIVLVKNENYWRGPVNLDKIVFKIVPEAQTREAMLLAGDVDMIVLPPATDIPALESNPDIVVVKADSTRYLLLGILPKGPLADKRVRQALNYAIDKESIVKNVLFGLARVADSPMPPGFFGYKQMPVYKYDPEKAKQLLAEAGYPNGFKVKLLTPTGRYLFDRQVAEAIQSQLAKIGIEVELITPDWPTLVSMIFKPLNETEHDLLLIGWGPWVLDADFMLYPTLHSSQLPPKAFNFAFFVNEEVDKLLDEARKEVDPAKRQKLYEQAVEIIWDECPWVFLYTQKYVIAYRSYVKNVVILPIEKFDVKFADIEG